MAQIVFLRQYTSTQVGGLPLTMRPGDVVSDTDITAAEFAMLRTAALAVLAAADYDVPAMQPELQAAQLQAIAQRLRAVPDDAVAVDTMQPGLIRELQP